MSPRRFKTPRDFNPVNLQPPRGTSGRSGEARLLAGSSTDGKEIIRLDKNDAWYLR